MSIRLINAVHITRQLNPICGKTVTATYGTKVTQASNYLFWRLNEMICSALQRQLWMCVGDARNSILTSLVTTYYELTPNLSERHLTESTVPSRIQYVGRSRIGTDPNHLELELIVHRFRRISHALL
jgi:hypothetical protein